MGQRIKSLLSDRFGESLVHKLGQRNGQELNVVGRSVVGPVLSFSLD